MSSARSSVIIPYRRISTKTRNGTSLRDALEYDRDRFLAGQVWRLFSWHWTHWSSSHLFWDVGVFAVMAAFCETAGRRAFLATMLLSTLAVSVAVFIVYPELAACRGLSGIDSALFCFLVGRCSEFS